MPLKLLALETTGLAGSVALAEDGRPISERTLTPGQRSAQSLAPGIHHLLAEADLGQQVAELTRALAAIDTGEVTVAVRDAEIDGVAVKAGDVIGLLNDKLTTSGSSPEDVVFNLLAQMGAGEAEIITVYYGDQIDAGAAHALRAQVAATYSGQEVEVIAGGQPHYHYILSTE